jgi:hypothetical protein
MPAHKLNSVRKAFDESLESALLLFLVAERSASEELLQSDSDPVIRPGQARRIAGLAVLVMVRAWEELVEACLVRYIAGASAPSGYGPERLSTATFTLKSAFMHASKNGLRGGPDHLSVSEWDRVCACARSILRNGEPFTRIEPLHKDRLAAATKIRHRVAHSSAKTRKEFNEVARQHLGRRAGQPLPRGYTVGHLMMTSGQRCVGQGAGKQAYFRHYHQLFNSMADIICPKQTADDDQEV